LGYRISDFITAYAVKVAIFLYDAVLSTKGYSPTVHTNFFLITSFLTHNFFIKERIAVIAQLNNIASP
jgi:hypothetical protein